MKNEPIIGEQKSSQPGQSFFFLFNFFFSSSVERKSSQPARANQHSTKKYIKNKK